MPIESGFKLEDLAVTRYSDMKLGSKATRFIILKLNKDTGAIVIDEECMKTDIDQRDDFNNLISKLTESEGRFIIMDLKAERQNGSKADQLFFITWNPDNSSINSKTLYSTARQNVISVLKLESVCVIQANDFDDLDYNDLMKKAKR